MEYMLGADGIILCGGKATRLKGVNGTLPKCLLKVHGRSVLGHLIYHLSSKLDNITLSYHKDKNIILEALRLELDESLLSKLIFENDPSQEGTALAVQRHHSRIDRALTVVNGDTLYDDFNNIIPLIIETNTIIFSTSYQRVDRAGAVTINKTSKMIEFSKNREGGLNHEGWVTNGIISIGSGALNIFKSKKLEAGTSIEKSLLELQHDRKISARLHNTGAKFMDIGVPEEFLNADASFKRLIASQRNSSGSDYP